jgi:hypothetical protein
MGLNLLKRGLIKMKFDLTELNPGVFFSFDENEDGAGGVTIRLANGKILDEINKACIKKKVEFRRGQRHEVIIDNDELRSKMLWEYVIIDWKGLYDQDGKEIPCTKENKVMLMQGSVKFSSFIGNCVEKLTEETEAYEGNLEKN